MVESMPDKKGQDVGDREKQGIGWAVRKMQFGKHVQRSGWNGKGQYLGLQLPDVNSANTLPYVWIMTVQGQRVPWLCSQTDLLAEDWQLVVDKDFPNGRKAVDSVGTRVTAQPVAQGVGGKS